MQRGKSKLKLVHTKAKGAGSPPRRLGKYGTALWRSVQAAYQIQDVGGIELLCQACQAADRAEALREQIDASGELIKLKGGTLRDNPLLKHELACRSFVVRTLARLGLDVEAVKPIGRPGQGIGVTLENWENAD